MASDQVMRRELRKFYLEGRSIGEERYVRLDLFLEPGTNRLRYAAVGCAGSRSGSEKGPNAFHVVGSTTLGPTVHQAILRMLRERHV